MVILLMWLRTVAVRRGGPCLKVQRWSVADANTSVDLSDAVVQALIVRS